MVPKVGFVMFSFARSGTSMAMNLIGQHPDAFCHTEVFSKRPRAKPLQEAFVKVHGSEGRLEDPLGFARKVLGFSPGEPCVGFKMWRTQAPEAADALLQDPSVHKIIHVRENVLAWWSSQQIARHIPMSHIVSDEAQALSDATERPALRFDRAAFETAVDRRQRAVARLLSKAQGPTHMTRHEAIVRDGVGEVYDFLGLQPFAPEQIFRKLNTSDILARFDVADHMLIRETLEKIEHPEWVAEHQGGVP